MMVSRLVQLNFMPEERHDAYIQIKELSEREKECLRCVVAVCDTASAECGYMNALRPNAAERGRKYRQLSRHKRLEAERRYRAKNREALNAKRRAKRAETV